AGGMFGGLRRIETQHVGQYAFLVDRSNRFLARVTSSVAHQMHELIEPALRSFTGSLALYSSFVSSVLKKLLTLGCPARSAWISLPCCRTLHRPQICTSGFGASSLVGSSTTIEKTLAWVFESTPVHGDLPLR